MELWSRLPGCRTAFDGGLTDTSKAAMRQTSAESREIDQMMRQWKPAEPTPVTNSGASTTSLTTQEWLSKTCSSALHSCLFVLLATGASIAMAQEPAAPLPTRTTLTVASAEAAVKPETVLTAHVTDTTGRPLVEASGVGTVSFETAAASLGSAIVDENGEASVTLSSLPTGKDGAALAVRAVYHPVPATDGGTAASRSTAAIVQPDLAGVPDFSITANPSTITVKQGLSGTSALTVTPINGFSEQVTLSCSNLPAQVTCTFSPVIASTANGAFTSTLQIQTQATSGALTPPDFGIGRRSPVAFAWILPGILALAGFRSLRRRALSPSAVGTALMIPLLLLASGALLGLSGCSSRYGYIHHPPSVATGTPTGTYALNIAASGNDGSAVTIHNISLTLQVQ